MRKLFSILIFLLPVLFFFACSKDGEDPSEPSKKEVTLSGDFYENHSSHAICRLHDGSFAITAVTAASKQLYVAVLDPQLNVKWEKKFGSNIDNAGGIIESSDGGIVIAANRFVENQVHPSKYCLVLTKLNASGTLVWEKTYWFYSSYWEDYPVVETHDKGFVVPVIYPLPEDTLACYQTLFKTDQNGDSLWIKGIPDLFNCVAFDLGMTQDEDFLLASMCAVSRTDSNGNLEWSRYPGYLASSLCVLQSGLVASLGVTLADSGTIIVLSQTDVSGNTMWKKDLKLGYDIEVYNLYQTAGGFVFMSKINGVLRMIKTDSRGNILTDTSIDGYSSSGFVPAGDLFCCLITDYTYPATSVKLIIKLVN